MSKGQTISFSESSHVAYQIKANDVGSNMVANILPTDTLDPGGGVKRSNYIFSESSHVAYQIKGNRAQSNLKANMLSLHTPMTPGVGSKGHFNFSFLKVVMLRIYFEFTHTLDLWGWV